MSGEHAGQQRPVLEDFPVQRRVSTRWADNDSYGHMNNAVHYQLFDSVINAWLAGAVPDMVRAGAAIGVVAHSECSYFAELAYPDDVVVGLQVQRIGRTSVTYRLGLFAHPVGAAEPVDTVAAVGRWTHVYVDASTRTPTPLPDPLRTALTGLIAT